MQLATCTLRGASKLLVIYAHCVADTSIQQWWIHRPTGVTWWSWHTIHARRSTNTNPVTPPPHSRGPPFPGPGIGVRVRVRRTPGMADRNPPIQSHTCALIVAISATLGREEQNTWRQVTCNHFQDAFSYQQCFNYIFSTTRTRLSL